jgi:hypothetical protein
LSKGDKPYSSSKIQQKLQKQWKTTSPWSLLSLGRGYFEFYFASEADMRSVWAMGTIHLKPGVLRLFEWTRDFNMHKQKNTHAQVWIRLMELPQEYWIERTLKVSPFLLRWFMDGFRSSARTVRTLDII